MSSVEDRLFLAWRRSGDPAELAEIYDRTAEGLLRLALHLTSQPAHAEDLVQATFVAAIEAADRYDGRRPLLGWLTGILHNQAKWHNRREARSPDAARLRGKAAPDPVQLAARAEFTEQVDAAIAALPEVYRPVLRLSLKHHMQAAQIAHALGRPAGTVRSQVARGLELLRNALPKGAVGTALGAAFAALVPRRGLAAVKQQVLASGAAQAAVTAPAALAAATTGVLVMKKIVFAVAAAAAVLAVVSATGAFEATPAANGIAPPSVAAENSVQSEGDAENAASRPATTTSPDAAVQRTVAAATRTSASQTTIVGRCVDEHGQPLAGCRMVLTGSPSGAQQRREAWLLEHGSLPAWEAPEAVVTDGDGRFQFAFEPPEPFRFTLCAEHSRRVRTQASWSKLARGANVDVGDVVMLPGVRVHGRLVDTRGLPQARRNVALMRTAQDSVPEGQPRPISGTGTRTSADGSFTMSMLLTPGHYSAHSSGLELAKHVQYVLSLDRPEPRIEVVVTSPDDGWHITGRVLDEGGRPVSDIEVRADYKRSRERYSTRTRRDGTYDLRTNEPPKGKTLALVVDAEGFECDPEPREVAWGSSDVEFRVARGGLLTVRVTDDKQRAIERYRVRLIRRDSTAWGVGHDRKPSVGEHPDGIATLPGLTSGAWFVCVRFPESEDLDTLFEPLKLEAPRPVRLDLVARKPSERSLRVLAMDGTPVASSTVKLCDAFGTRMHDRPLLSMDGWHLVHGTDDRVLVLREFVTDADGRAVLRGPTGRDLGLAIAGPGHVDQRHEPIRIGEGPELIVRVVAAAELRGKVGPPAVLTELRQLAELERGEPFRRRAPWLELKAVDSHERFPKLGSRRPQPLQIGDDGSFSADCVPAGTWQVELCYWRASGSKRLLVGSVTLTGGQSTDFDLDASGLLPGSLEGVVRHNGAPLANHQVTLIVSNTHYQAQTDAQGRFVLCAIGGSCTCQARLGEGSELTSNNSVAIVRGETRRGEFQLVSGRVRIRLLDPDGKPVSQVSLMRRSTDIPNGYFLPPVDIEGRLTLDLKPGSYTFHALPRRLDDLDSMNGLRQQAREAGRKDAYGPHLLHLGAVTLQVGDDEQVELKLPRAWRQ